MGITGAMTGVTGPIRRANARNVTLTNLEPYAMGMVAFNTGPTFKPVDMLLSSANQVTMQVPKYGEMSVPIPYGFEVGVVGSNSARSILVRLSLAARLNTGGKIVGWPHQQIVQMMDN